MRRSCLSLTAWMIVAGAAAAADSSKIPIQKVFLNGQELQQLGGVPLQNIFIEVTPAGSLHIYTSQAPGPGLSGKADTRSTPVIPTSPLPVTTRPSADNVLAASAANASQNQSSPQDTLMGTYWILFIPEALPAGISTTIWVNDSILDVLGSTEQQVKEVTHLLKRGDNTVKVSFSAAPGLGLQAPGRVQLTLAQGGLDAASQELRLEYPILSLTRATSELPGHPEFFKFTLPLPARN